MNILPKPSDTVIWLKEIATSCVISFSTVIGSICILVYMLSIIALSMEGDVKLNAKKYAISSLMTYILSKAIIFLIS